MNDARLVENDLRFELALMTADRDKCWATMREVAEDLRAGATIESEWVLALADRLDPQSSERAEARAEAAEVALREVAKRLDDVYDALANYRHIDPEDRLAPRPVVENPPA